MIKLIAVDMDDTFLDDNKDYDRTYFAKLFKRMQQQQVEFVVASGNQYDQLACFFDPYKDNISFVSQNGANIYIHQKPLYHAKMSQETQHLALRVLTKFKQTFIVACGFKKSYIATSTTDEEYEIASFYFPNIEKVESLENLSDDIFMYSLDCPDVDLDDYQNELSDDLQGALNVVKTGGNGIDLLLPEVNKANGIKMVQQQMKINDDQVAAFGDSGNDIEMLKHAKYSFAMSNATEEVKQVANEVIGNHNDSSVLKTIERLLNENEK